MNELAYLLIAPLFFTSCGEQAESDQPGESNGTMVEVIKEIQVSIQPMKSVGTPASRTAGAAHNKQEAISVTYVSDAPTRGADGTSGLTADEQKIVSAYVVQYGGNTPDAKVASVNNITSMLNSGGPVTCTFTMASGAKNRVYVLANVTTVPKVGDLLSDLSNPVSWTPTTDIPSTGLPMVSNYQDVELGDLFDVFRLQQTLARLTVHCSLGTGITGTPTLKLKGNPSVYSLFRDTTPGDEAIRPSGVTYDNTGVALTSGATYYVPENLSGRNKNLWSHTMRALGFAFPDALYVEITNHGTVYNLLLGDGSISDFNFVCGYSYDIKATIYGTNKHDLRIGNSVPAGSYKDPIIDLNSSGETANCYIVTTAKFNTLYMFDATVMGNGKSFTTPGNVMPGNFVGTDIIAKTLSPVRAEVLWESVNAATPPVAGTIVRNLSIAGSYVLFKTGSTSGNAVIAVKNGYGEIIWSWHIWRIPSQPLGRSLARITDGSGFIAPGSILMDRNLGALRATPNTGLTPELDYGLFYQWGRKDPFQTQGALSTASGGASITPADGIKKPTTFYTNSSISENWTSRNDNLWGCPLTGPVTISGSQFNKNVGAKTIYDPCPIGWRLPPAYTFANIPRFDDAWKGVGRDFAKITTASSTPFFFPASGFRRYDDGSLNFEDSRGFYWTSAPHVNNPNGRSILFFLNTNVSPASDDTEAVGNSCRCVKG